METLKVGRGEAARQVPVTEVGDRDLSWYAHECKSPRLQAIARAEVARRAGGGAIQRPTQALAAPVVTSLGMAMYDPAAVTEQLRSLSSSFHLVTPQTSVDALPEGFGVSVNYVTVNPDPDPYNGPKEVYDVGGRLGLSMDTLKRIAAAAGVDWDPRQSGRLDDAREPLYVHYRAVGYVRNFDGSTRTITGEVEIDAREGSPQIEEIVIKAQNAKKTVNSQSVPAPRDPRPQILELRKFILRHAESKAKNRAIADMGVKRSYAPQELQKPFAVARLMFTGQTSDPELRREFARMSAERALDGATRLYGAGAASALPAFQGHAPPSVGAVRDFDGHDYDADGEELPPSEPRNAAPTPTPAPAPAAAPAAAPPRTAQKPPPGAGDAWEPEGGL